MNKLIFLQLFRFGIIGTIAAAIHLSTVILLVQNFFLTPLTANIFGFLIAFQISYWGNRAWTFSQTIALHRSAFSKLLFVQAANFSANQLLFYIFLSLQLPYPVALIIVLAILPVFTFLSSKTWVFKA